MGESIKHTHSVRMIFKKKISELWKLSPIEVSESDVVERKMHLHYCSCHKSCHIVPALVFSLCLTLTIYILNTISLEIWFCLLENSLHLSVFNNKAYWYIKKQNILFIVKINHLGEWE